MKAAIARCLLAAILLSVAAGAIRAGQAKPGAPKAARFGRFTVESKHLEGTVGGSWEFSKGVTVNGPDLLVTCDTLKVWPGSKGGQDFDRAEAAGSVTVHARYIAKDGSEWKVLGTADTGAYDGKNGQGALRGAVKVNGTNQTTKAAFSVVADTMTYQVKSQQFQFERGGQPVFVQFQPPEQQPAAPKKQEGQK
jgi:lipopolysaccharide export system protein LptA